ncbi:hypothetical protein PGT21_034646 [Puccinia graminis f. sp. tritici]|uniref:PRELI/MSF1 domain-containing protein n=2 Tax=Puccinia graminis f. sp. tritici TaxID=56615 RepID=E3JRF9_PUCGT|nr:uncharacterized protein PGTG_00155 [Puccinia graminis f. sp. tritici CRL 75-36-700-3]EFP74199.1 hypothetical protein PGTG_00155 [Puccinia graminis f. sp. tritici CRL 75-36-700-3]KAA1106415.1 hypothetical protein PGT21_034646 [Puccinia graminis f. sp. tritici]KAA1126398.1 hypothetical protein PGTUg99_030887 [Puccinia graminis f. sp. tritici]
MVVFTAQHLFPFSFRDVALGIWHKYPNEHSTHITSVDVLDRSFLPDGTLRTERLISIRQHAPRWIMKLVGGAEEQYVREVIFYKVPSSPDQPPMVLMGSVNLSMSSILICREQIRYQPSHPQASSFFQRADIQAQGTLAIGESWGILGSKLESWARDRFSTNAESGRLGFNNVLTALYRDSQGRGSPGDADSRHQSPSGRSSTNLTADSQKDQQGLPADPTSASIRLA